MKNFAVFVLFTLFTSSLFAALFSLPVHADLDHVEGGVQVGNDFGEVNRGLDGVGNNNNQLWGDWFMVDEANSFADGDNFTHLEADGEKVARETGDSTGIFNQASGKSPVSRETGDSTGIFNVDGLEVETGTIEYRNGTTERTKTKTPGLNKNLDLPSVPPGSAGASSSAGKSGGTSIVDDVKNTVADAAETAKGAVEGAGYIVGVHGSSADQAAARKASAKDITSGNARDRSLGAADGYVNTVTFGIADPNLAQFAGNQQQAEVGKNYGETGAVVAGVLAANPAQLARNAARGGTQVVRQGAKATMAGGGVVAVDTNAKQ